MSAMIIGVLQQKGGVGKTTLALNLAGYFATNGARVLLVDADPQASALSWSSVRDKPALFPVVGMPKPTLHKDLLAIARNYDIVVIDGAPRVNDLGRSAILASDIVLIPVQPSPFDVWSASDIVGLISEALMLKPTLVAAFAINRKVANTAIGRDIAKAFASQPFPLLGATITQRVALAETAAQGLTIFDTAPSSPAAWEIAALADELLHLNDKKAAA